MKLSNNKNKLNQEKDTNGVGKENKWLNQVQAMLRAMHSGLWSPAKLKLGAGIERMQKNSYGEKEAWEQYKGTEG